VQPGDTGQFDVIVDGEVIASRGGNAVTRVLFGAGFPEFESVLDEIERRMSGGVAVV